MSEMVLYSVRQQSFVLWRYLHGLRLPPFLRTQHLSLKLKRHLGFRFLWRLPGTRQLTCFFPSKLASPLPKQRGLTPSLSSHWHSLPASKPPDSGGSQKIQEESERRWVGCNPNKWITHPSMPILDSWAGPTVVNLQHVSLGNDLFGSHCDSKVVCYEALLWE